MIAGLDMLMMVRSVLYYHMEIEWKIPSITLDRSVLDYHMKIDWKLPSITLDEEMQPTKVV